MTTTQNPANLPAPTSTEITGAVRSLQRHFEGELLLPGDDGYDLARLGWNRTVESHPAVIATAASTHDVQRAVVVAREHGLPLAVQATGHGTVVAADGALLLKTTLLSGVEIDPARRRARVGPGAVWDQVNVAAARFGLGSLAGRCATVGVTGYTLGGGTGWLSRKFGYAADSVVRAEVVTADGRTLTVDADRHPELFWALRGGGGNFGIVTSLEFRLYPAEQAFSGMSFYDAGRAVEAFAAYQDWAPSEPDEMTSAVLVTRLPPAPSVPELLRGQQVLAIRAFHLGSASSGRRILAPLLDAAGPPLLDAFAMRSFPAASAATNGPDVPPIALRQYVELFHHLPPDAIESTVNSGAAPDSPLAFVELRHWGGAMANPPDDAGPAGARGVPFSVMAVAPYLSPDRHRVDTHVDGLAGCLAPYATGGAFLNLLTDPSRTRDAFTTANYARLADTKRIWDAENVFRFHHNIPPASRFPHIEGNQP